MFDYIKERGSLVVGGIIGIVGAIAAWHIWSKKR